MARLSMCILPLDRRSHSDWHATSLAVSQAQVHHHALQPPRVSEVHIPDQALQRRRMLVRHPIAALEPACPSRKRLNQPMKAPMQRPQQAFERSMSGRV